MATSVSLNTNSHGAQELLKRAQNGDKNAVNELCSGLYNATAGRLGTDEDYVNTIMQNADSKTLASIMDNYSTVTGSEIYKDIENDYSGKDEKEILETLGNAYKEANDEEYTGWDDGKLSIFDTIKSIGKGLLNKLPSIGMTVGGVLLGKTVIGGVISGAVGTALSAVFGAGAATVATFAAPVLAAVGIVTAGVMVYKGIKQTVKAVNDGKNATTDEAAKNAVQSGAEGVIDTGLGVYTGVQSAKALKDSIKNVKEFKAQKRAQLEHKRKIEAEAQAKLEEERLAAQRAQEAQDEFNRPFEEKLSHKSAEESAQDLDDLLTKKHEELLDNRVSNAKAEAQEARLKGETIVEVDEKTVAELSDSSDKLAYEYKMHETEATEQIKKPFEELDSVDKVTGRSKSENSVYEKLAKKTSEHKLTSTDIDACRAKIGDAYGTRIIMKDVSQSEVEEILKKIGAECSYDDLCKFLSGEIDDLSADVQVFLKNNGNNILSAIKEFQNQEVVDMLIDKILHDPNFQISELNNYGDDLVSYFTDKQIQSISDAYYTATGKPLEGCSKHKILTDRVLNDGSHIQTCNLTTKGAEKPSGYPSAQMNTQQTFNDGSTGLGELQLRGNAVNNFAEVEHIPYDIRQGKIKLGDKKYGSIVDLVKKLSPKSYDLYNGYLRDVYRHLRLKELGIATSMPKLPTGFITEEGENLDHLVSTMLDYDSLIKLGH